MKTNSMKQTISLVVFFLVVMAFLLAGCKSEMQIVTGPRVYYDFNKKQLYKNAKHDTLLTRPLTMNETRELQVEITNFNPLKYDIVTKDTAYDRFEPNVDYFNKLINYPNLKIDPKTEDKLSVVPKGQKAITRGQGNLDIKPIPTSCDTLSLQLAALSVLRSKANENITGYKVYISYVENIISYYDYLKSLEVIDKKRVEAGIVSNIIAPIKHNYQNKLKTNSRQVYKKDFIEIESTCYQKISKLKEELESSIRIVSELKNTTKCKLFDANKAKFDKNSKELSVAIDEFETSRKNVVLPNFTKVMLVYEKLQALAQSDPLFITKSFPINKDIQIINIFKYYPETKSKQEHDAITIQMTNGFRIDVSGGLFVSGLYDKKYSIYSKNMIFNSLYIDNGKLRDTLKEDKFTAIYENANAKFSYGGMVYLQGHTQNAELFNWGVYLGMGTLFSDQTRWTGSFGATLIYGRSQRFSVNIGPILSQVDRLDSPYRTNTFYQNNFDKMPVSRVWMSSMMLGCSWKIGK